MNNHIFRAMNSEICLQGLNAEQNQNIEELFNSAQALLSRFIADSDVCLLNMDTESWLQVQPITFAVLCDAYQAFVDTEGLFNPFLGQVIATLGYDRSFDQLQQTSNSVSRRDSQHVQLPSEPLQFDHDNMRVRLSYPACIDLGGYAKGWIAQLAMQYLIGEGVTSGIIDAGGDIVGCGQSWAIDIVHPLADEQTIATIEMDGICAVATSSTIYRRWTNCDHITAHHIIDPRTLKSTETDLLQVSIITDNLAKAEQLTKCLLILGEQEGVNWLQEHYPDIGYVLVMDSGQIIIKDK